MKGRGSALSVVKGLARLHGGRFELESTLGQGTTAIIVLPLDGPVELVETPVELKKVSAASAA